MAGKFTASYGSGGDTLYIYAVRAKDASAHTIVMDDDGGGEYSGDMPSTAGLGQYLCKVFKQLGELADPDTDTILGWMTGVWSGESFDFDEAVGVAFTTYNRQGITWSDRP